CHSELLSARSFRRAEGERAHGEILVATRRLVRIVEMLEFFASAGAGRSVLSAKDLDLGELARTVVKSWSTRVPPGHRLSTRVSRGLPVVRGDRRWLSAALEELIDNAVKFSPAGGSVEVTVGAAQGPSGVAGVEVAVADRGHGLGDDQVAALLGEFAQADGSDTRRFGGLGLGLTLVQRVAEGHGGTVTHTSGRRRGSRFGIWVPVPGSARSRRPARR
ncbi:MAG: sensor histidine kinase, partial [Acidimicrobiales bacterium]